MATWLQFVCYQPGEKRRTTYGGKEEKGKRAAEIKLFNCAIKCTFVAFCATSVPCAGVDADPQPQRGVEVGTGNSIVEIIITLGRARMRDSFTLSLRLFRAVERSEPA